MYVKAIEKNREWTFPIILGIKNNKLKEVELFVATIIKINNEGCFLTCKHVADMLVNHFNNPDNSHLILPIKLLNDTKIDIINHKYLDLAIIKFDNVIMEGGCPTFETEIPSPGMSVCKLGYAFPNGNPFDYDKKTKQIVINSNEMFETPLFPLDGIVTRNVNYNIDGNIIANAAFETSTAGLRGQSGGPIFDKTGKVYGIQSINMTMPLNYSYDKRSNFDQFINFGIGISSQKIISFLDEFNIKYN